MTMRKFNILIGDTIRVRLLDGTTDDRYLEDTTSKEDSDIATITISDDTGIVSAARWNTTDLCWDETE